MELHKTTILPTDDADLAKRLFDRLIFEEPHFLLVVLGVGPDAETFAQRADRLAGAPGEPRRVVWARQPADIVASVRRLRGADALVGQLGTARGFALSIDEEVRDVIPANEAVPSLSRIMLAWSRAEASA